MKKKLEKNLNAEKKTERGDPLRFFNIYSVAKQQKKLKGGPFGKIFFLKKSLAVPKKIERGSRPVWYVTLENRKTFFVQFARPNSAIWCNNIL